MQADRLGQAFQRGWLDEVPDAVMLVDAQRRILWLNLRAQAMMEAGRFLSAQGEILLAGMPRLAAALDAAMMELPAAADGSQACRVLRWPQPHGALVLGFLSLVRCADVPAGTCFALVVHEAGQARGLPHPQLLSRCFGFSPAEARVAVGLCEGLDVKALARREGNSVNTVRSQVRGVLEKTRTTRQADLLRLLLSLPVRH